MPQSIMLQQRSLFRELGDAIKFWAMIAVMVAVCSIISYSYGYENGKAEQERHTSVAPGEQHYG
jgi:hypothetical protein